MAFAPLRSAWILPALFVAAFALPTVLSAAEPTWKTAYVKRGYVGALNSNHDDAGTATWRARTPLAYDGTQFRVAVLGLYDQDVVDSRMTLAKGANDDGEITGPLYPILFGGNPTCTIPKRSNPLVSDGAPAPITRGTWYLQECFTSPKMPYAYDVDPMFYEKGDAQDHPTLKERRGGQHDGAAWRIDVLTTDPRTSIICYGDSITHGYNSTPNSNHRYPDVLGKLLDRPVLNIGQNGDVIAEYGRATSVLDQISGADTVVVMIGINDIIGMNRIKTTSQYANAAAGLLMHLRGRKLKTYLGTIPPAGGNKAFDSDPAKEVLRTEINAWIREKSGADGIIDFDHALADPSNPGRMKTEYQSDWLHPNDAGYQKMAETAAKAISGVSK